MRTWLRPLLFVLACAVIVSLTQVEWNSERATSPPHVRPVDSHRTTTTSTTTRTTTTVPPPPPTEAPVTTTLAPPPTAPPVDPAPAPQSAPQASGARSYAWWEAIATCESGNTNAWRTGYYGLEGGPGVTYGGLDKAAQLAIAEDIYARAGDGAWGCSPVAWSMVPGG